jgi:hypothetical protein
MEKPAIVSNVKPVAQEVAAETSIVEENIKVSFWCIKK